MKAKSLPAIGNLVQIHDPNLASQLGRVDECGVVVRLRKGGARILFPRDYGCFWIEDPRLWIFPESYDPGSAFLKSLGELLRVLKPEEVEVDEIFEDHIRFHFQCMGLSSSQLDELGSQPKETLLHWSIQPFGMAVFTLILDISL